LAQVKIITRTDSLFFVGIDNEIIIKSSEITIEKLSIVVSGGLFSGKNGKYIVRCSTPGTDASIKIFYLSKLIAEKKMQVVRVSEPVVYVAGDTLITGGLISKKHLFAFDSLIVKTNVPYLAMTVIHFEFKKVSNGQITDSIKNFGYKFSAQIKQLLAKAVKGDVFIFDEAFSTGPDDNGTIYQSIKLTVTD
jgi:hypothetical protein